MKEKQDAVSHLTKLRQVLKSNLEKIGATKKDVEECAICTQSLFECPENEGSNSQNQKYYDRMKHACCDKFKCKHYFTNPAAHLRQPNTGITINANEEDPLPNLPKCNSNLSELGVSHFANFEKRLILIEWCVGLYRLCVYYLCDL